MNTTRCLSILAVTLLGAFSAMAVTHYVSVNSTNPVPPYTNWSTAANVIQDAVDVAVSGDTVLVTNGVYDVGGKAVYGAMTNRVAVDKPLTLLSVNGSEFTTIKGFQLPGITNGDGAIRCVYLTNGASLSGFTLTNGATRAAGDYQRERCGGGLWCESTNAWASNCVVTGNSADAGGGGSYSGTLNYCTLTGNSATSGGGSSGGTLNNCTITGNSAYDLGGGAGGGTLNNCTITCNTAGYSGGGSYSGTLNNCILTDNSAVSIGGGSYFGTLNNCTLAGNRAGVGGGSSYGTLNNCTLTGNSAGSGGGSRYGTLNNCTLTGNSATYSGGSHESMLRNCIVYFNSASISDHNYSGGMLDFCCTTPLPFGGTGNISVDPLLVGVSHLSAGSPCRAAGSAAYTTGTDIDGELWASPPSIGCDEYWTGSVTGALSVAVEASYTNVAVGLTVDFAAQISGRTTDSAWDLGGGTVVSNQPYASQAWAAAGDYPVVLRAYNESWPAGVSATVMVQVVERPVHYVVADGANPVPPYDSWVTAATNIQDAIDAAFAGGTVWVTNGTYATGGKAVFGTMTNRVAVDKPLTLLSVNGPELTIIQGYQVPGTTDGDGAVRCVYLADGALLSGFTLTNGATRAVGDYELERSGGGLLCESTNAWASNCVVIGNSAAAYGGGSSGGRLNNCTLTDNSAGSGGGSRYGTLNNCTLTGNSAYSGGGSSYGTLNNCTLTGNSAYSGGGAYETTLNNCTLTGNSATYGGGAYWGTLTNCIVYFNTASSYDNNYAAGSLNYCCTTPPPSGGEGNITNAPLLVDTNNWVNLRLQSNSPCINAADNTYATTTSDLDGRTRIVAGTVDMGAYEYQGEGMSEFIGWLDEFDLPTDGSADHTDSDSDSATTWQEWKMWTIPTNEQSVLRMLHPDPDTNGMEVAWQSVSGHSYTLERATNSSANFTVLQSGVAGQAGTTSFTDTTATNGDVFFYRVSVPE